jgi:septum formation protein
MGLTSLQKVILASTSPRRREILDLLKIPFEVHAPKFSELSDPSLSSEEEARLFAREKALSLRKEFPNSLIIGSDTIVELNGKKLGKPRDDAEATQMLQSLSGKTHRVLTGLAVLDMKTGLIQEILSIAKVTMKASSEKEIAEYVASGEPRDKAGAYAVQGLGKKLIESVEGDFYTVVGLPLEGLVKLLKNFGSSISIDS